MSALEKLLNTQVWGTTPVTYLIAAGLVLTITFVVLGIKRFLLSKLRRLAPQTATLWDDWLLAILPATRTMLVLAMSAWAGSQLLGLPANFARGIDRLAVLALLIQSGLWISRSIKFWLAHRFADAETDAAQSMTAPLLGFVLRTATWAIIVLMLLDNLGFNVTTLVASLGVGGVAVALAVQNILGDLFASLSIALDKPFVIGDFIVVDELSGTVEHVGLKTTRIRSISGEQIIFSNNDLLRSRIRNYKRMQERRVLFGFGVVYDVPPELLERIPSMVKEAVSQVEKVRFDRAHFKSFGASSLDFEVVYYVLDTDYGAYMDAQQAINLGIAKRLQEAGIDFAFPTQTLHFGSPLPRRGAMQLAEAGGAPKARVAA